MQNHKPHSQKAPQTGHSIFGTILFSLLAVLAVGVPAADPLPSTSPGLAPS